MDKASKPDQVEKLLEDWHDVFADIINVLVYHGDRRVCPDDLVDSPTASQYKAVSGRYEEKIRDICKKEIKEGKCYAVLGIENQTEICQTMPLRVLQYDAAMYDMLVKDLQDKNKTEGHEAKYAEVLLPGQKIPPVHTVVLYFGLKPWTGPKSLSEMLEIPEDCAMTISDYPIHIVEVAFLEDEVIEQFTSDFRVIAKFFKAKRLGTEREMMYNDNQQWNHVSEMLEFFHTFTGDERYQEYKQHLIHEAKKGEFKMCTLLDAFEQKGIARGHYEMAERVAKVDHIDIEAAMTKLCFSETEKRNYYNWVAAGRQ